MKDFKNILVTHGYKEPKHYTCSTCSFKKHFDTHSSFQVGCKLFWNFTNRRGSVILINIIIGKLLFGWPAYISRLRMQSAGSNPGSTYTWSKNHVVSSKLCCDISRVLHEMPTSFIHNSIKYFAYLALYDKEQHSKLIYIVSSTHLLTV